MGTFDRYVIFSILLKNNDTLLRYLVFDCFRQKMVRFLIQVLSLFSAVKIIRSAPLSTDQYLTHYWPFANGLMKDVKGSAHMIQGNLTSFTSNRFDCPNSALALNSGWAQVPPGAYFNTSQFTISVWVYPLSVSSWSRIIDFGNDEVVDSIILSLSYENYLKPYLRIFSGSTIKFTVISSQSLALNQWQFLVATFNGTNAAIYLNGELMSDYTDQIYILPTDITRSNCFIGKSNRVSHGYSDSYLDDLRIYDQSLTQSEILELMISQNKPSKKKLIFSIKKLQKFKKNSTKN
jgi:hypothetical protein